jgi:hypothetical protein
VLVGGTGLRQVTLGRAVSGPLPGLPDHGRLVTKLLAADYQACHGTIRRALGRLQDEGLIVTPPR